MEQKPPRILKPNIIPHNNWVPVYNFIYIKLAGKHMGVAGAGPFAEAANEFHIFSKSKFWISKVYI